MTIQLTRLNLCSLLAPWTTEASRTFCHFLDQEVGLASIPSALILQDLCHSNAPDGATLEAFVENHIVLGVVGPVHVHSGNQHLRDGIIVPTILIITDAHIVAKEICQWGIKGVAALVQCPSIEGILKVKPVFEVLQFQRVLWSFVMHNTDHQMLT